MQCTVECITAHGTGLKLNTHTHRVQANIPGVCVLNVGGGCVNIGVLVVFNHKYNFISVNKCSLKKNLFPRNTTGPTLRPGTIHVLGYFFLNTLTFQYNANIL